MELKGKKISSAGAKNPVQKRWQTDGSVTYYFQGNCGDASMRVYAIFPGVKLIFHEVYRENSHLGASKKGEQVEIHYCREGRMEHMLSDSYFCLGSGDLGIHKVQKGTTEFALPMRHYHGITISIHTDLAMQQSRCIWERMEINPMDAVARLCADNPCVVIRRQESLQRLFSEFYQIPIENKKGFYRVKLLELFLILSDLQPKTGTGSVRLISYERAELAQTVAAYLAEHKGKHLTVQTLAQQFHVSATYLQDTFKCVFGMPVFSYLRVQKMHLAARDLIETQKTVMEIANACGYDNASKFSSAFREVMHQTPLEYRRRRRTEENGDFK